MSQQFQLEIANDPPLDEADYQLSTGFNSGQNGNDPSGSCPFSPSAFSLAALEDKIPKKSTKKTTKLKTKKTVTPFTKPTIFGTPDRASLDQINKTLKTNVNFNVLANNEGRQALDGYVPQAGVSGVTFATGVDAGQQDLKHLQAMGLDQSVIDKLKPYLGLHRNAALKALQAQKDAGTLQNLTQAEATQLDQKFHEQFVKTAMASYNFRRQKGVVDFTKLTPAEQTVLVDLTYNIGPGLPTSASAKTFYADVTKGDWTGAIAAMRNWQVPKTVKTKGPDGKIVKKTVMVPAPPWMQNRLNHDADLLQAEINAANAKK